MGKTVLLLFTIAAFATIILSLFAGAEQYYADLTLDVQADGSVIISGITNDASFAPGTYQTFTSKKGIYWLLNISSNKEFSDYILTVTLPEGSEFNYLKTDGRSRVSYDDGIKIVASGSDSMNLLVQYHIEAVQKSHKLWWIIYVLLIILILGFISWRMYFRKINLKNSSLNDDITKEKTANNVSNTNPIDAKEYSNILLIKKTLAESQEKIIDLLIEAGGALVQNQLQHRSGLPKATLSRNVDILVKKGIITKQSRGMTNMITLNKEFTGR